MALDASAVAKLLHEFGQRTALRGGNTYRARAYSRAAGNLLALTLPLDQIVAAMRQDIPAGVLELLFVPGLRPEKVLKLYSELGIASLEGLEQAARQDRLKNVKGLGAALQSKILQGIDVKRRGEGQRHVHRAAALLDAAEANLRRLHPASHALRLPATSAAVANWSSTCPSWRKSRGSTERRRSA